MPPSSRSVVERWVGRGATRFFGVTMLAVAAVALVSPRNSWFVFDRSLVWASAAGTLAVAWLLGSKRDTASVRGLLPAAGGRSLVVAGTIAVTMVAAVLARASMIAFGWDAGAVADAAGVLAEDGALDLHLMDYFARYPNNVPFLWVETQSVRVGALVGLPAVESLVVLQLGLVALITYCLGATALVLGRPRLILLAQAVGAVLIAWSPHVATPYTDVPGAACTAVAVLGTAHAHRAGAVPARALWTAVGVTAISVGFLFKPYVAVLLVAMAIMVLAGSRSWPERGRTVLRLAAGGLLAVLTALLLGQLAGHGTGLTAQRLEDVRAPFPVELWVATGTYDSQDPSPVRRYGAYNQALVEEAAGIDDPRAQRLMLRARIAEQLGGRGLAGSVSFFAAKVSWVWGDGTFWAHGEGTDSGQPAYDRAGQLKTVSEWTVATGEHYRERAALVNGVWLALLLIVGRSALRAADNRLHATWALALIGLSVYLMIFEARPRYVLALVPVVIAMTFFPAGTKSSVEAVGRPAHRRAPTR